MRVTSLPSLRSPAARVAGLLLVWTVLGTLGFARHYWQEPVQFWPGLIEWLPCYWAWIPLTPVVFSIERRSAKATSLLRHRVPMLLAASIALPYAAGALVAPLLHGAVEGSVRAMTPIWMLAPFEFFLHQFMFWPTLGAAYLMRKLGDTRRKEREAASLALQKADLEASLQRTQLELLRSRLNPHFLFNSLQNISVLAQREPKLASRMLVRLGDVLRAAFKSDFQAEVTLDTELAITQAYLDIEKMRFGDRLRVAMHISPETREMKVPSLLLQPLVENALIHGLDGASDDGCITISAAATENRLILSVADNGVGLSSRTAQAPRGNGIGLASVYERLERLYPGEHEVALEKGVDGGVEVVIALPLSKRPAAPGYADTGSAHTLPQILLANDASTLASSR